jgi:hypothetical protein
MCGCGSRFKTKKNPKKDTLTGNFSCEILFYFLYFFVWGIPFQSVGNFHYLYDNKSNIKQCKNNSTQSDRGQRSTSSGCDS